jgi:3-hydroxyacyl-[acyl-carrier-protein] dehydratase
MPPVLHLDPTTLDLTKVVADRAAIRAVNPHRFEMEQFDAVVLVDPERHVIAGYRDVRPDEFWVRGHFPQRALFPGVLMCESAAQMCSYYISKHSLLPADLIALGGLEDARFRAPVQVGDRLVMIARATRLHRRQTVFNVQGFVGPTMAFHVDIIGVPLSLAAKE